MRGILIIGFAVLALCGASLALAQDAPAINRADRGRIRDSKETMRTLADELRLYQQMRDEYPAQLKGLLDLNLREALPKDAWDRDFGYELSAEKGYRLTCFGADGKKGGAGADADIIWTRDGELRELSTNELAALERQRQEARFQAHRVVAQKEMVVVGVAAVAHRRDKGAWPTELKELRTKAETDEAKAVDACFTDPWGNPYVFRALPNENFAIICWGADGKEGGTDHDADFVITEKEVRPAYVRRARWSRWGMRNVNLDWQAHQIADSVRQFKKKVGRLPTQLDELLVPGLTPDGNAIRRNIPRDRYGKEYAYLVYGPDEFFVVGLGKDMIQGGTGENADSITPEPGAVERDYDEFEAPPQEDQDALRVEVAQEQALDIADKVAAHKAEHGTWPDSLEAVKARFPGEVVPLDPWGNAFVLELVKDANGEVTGFTVTSRGRDGAVGGAGHDADIVVNDKKEVK
ncbi:MAG: type II secretion system protein GspG [Planctomycetes bacterium]|nr:type II secretion system protein GspG [Planctomycetota bacterium]